jgi:type II secretion system protein G
MPTPELRAHSTAERSLAGPHARLSRRAFTLIELLIVVAIIAILAAIAVPNFLEAQVRAKVSRTKSDMRSLATAIEAYRVDTNKYPVVGTPGLPTFADLLVPFTRRLSAITTPVSYISSLPQDPFANTRKPEVGFGFIDPSYVYAPGNLYFGDLGSYDNETFRHSVFSLASRGPDQIVFFGNYCMAHPIAVQGQRDLIGAYDPTNGTVSEGDIFRLGGSRIR